MSRIGKSPISVPAGVDVSIEGRHVAVKGPKGQMALDLVPEVDLERENGTINVSRRDESGRSRSMHGLTRTLINNMVIGVSNGFEKTLEIEGVGYRATMQGDN